MKLIFDLETNGFMPKMDRIHTLSIKDAESDRRWTFRKHGHVKGVRFDGTPYEFEPRDDMAIGLEMLADADVVIGHNIIPFDLRAIVHVYPDWKTGAKPIDTLVCTRLIMPDTTALDYKLIAHKKFPPSLVGKHGLEAWGYRLSGALGIDIMKGDYSVKCKELGRDPWAEWNPDMEEYGDQDVVVTDWLWKYVESDLPEGISANFEHDIAALATKIRENGYPFDHAAALTLRDELEAARVKHVEVVKQKYGFWYAPEKKRIVRPVYEDPDIKERPTPLSKATKTAARTEKQVDRSEYQANGYMRPRPEFGEDDSRSIWAEVDVPEKNRRRKMVLPDGQTYTSYWSAGAPYCKIKRIEFNPGSRLQIADRLVINHGWAPADFTETGQPEINDAVLMALVDRIPEAAAFADIFFYNKLLGQLHSGKKSWLDAYDPDTGRIHGNINTGGTVSGRCSHSDPNLGQVPSVMDTEPVGKDGKFNSACTGEDGQLKSWCFNPDGTIKKKVLLPGRVGEYGIECRSLFYTPKIWRGVPWMQIGCDLKNIEARCLAEAFAPYDDGELIDVLVNQGIDLHTYNMKATGISNRGLIKRVFFGLIYGAGDLKLGITAEPYWSERKQRALGADLRATIMRGIPALAKATEAVKREARSGYLIGLDGRRLQVRAEYAALNLRLQSAAALIAKKWALRCEERLIEDGGIHGWDGDFAMLAFVHDEIQTAIQAHYVEQASRHFCEAAREAGEFFKFACPVEAEAKVGHNWYECH